MTFELRKFCYSNIYFAARGNSTTPLPPSYAPVDVLICLAVGESMLTEVNYME
jgi:hypothetical protein